MRLGSNLMRKSRELAKKPSIFQRTASDGVAPVESLISEMQVLVNTSQGKKIGELPFIDSRKCENYKRQLASLKSQFYVHSEFDKLQRNLTAFQEQQTHLQATSPDRVKEIEARTEEFIKYPTISAAGFVGARNLEWYELPLRMLALGSAGAGKSMFLEMVLHPLYHAIAERIKKPKTEEQISPLRVLIFDVDGNTLPIIDGVGIGANARYFLNPYDERDEEHGFVGWAAGEDLNSRDAIVRFTEILVPKDDAKSEHFNELVRQMLQVVMMHLRDEKGKNWELYEALFILVSRQKYLEDILKNHPPFHYEGLYESVFGRQAHAQDTMSTISSKLRGFLDIAALWQQRTKKISIRRWLGTSSVLALGWQGGTSEWMSRLNQALIQLFTDIMVNEEPETLYPTTAVVIDEATLLAPLPGVDDLCTYCRKKGVSIYIAFQSIPLAEQEFGEGTIKAILGQCDVKALLRQNCADTARWMAERCGEAMKDDYLVDISFGVSNQTSVNLNSSQTAGVNSGKSNTVGKGSSYSETEQDSIQDSVTKTFGTSESWGWSGGYSNSSSSNSDSTAFGCSTGRSTGTQTSTNKNTSHTKSSGSQYSETAGAGFGVQSGESQNLSIRQQRESRPRIEYAEFLDLPQTTPQTGMTGIVIAPNIHTRKDDICRIHLPSFLINQIRPPRSDVKGFVIRDPRDSELLQKLAHTELSIKYKQESNGDP